MRVSGRVAGGAARAARPSSFRAAGGAKAAVQPLDPGVQRIQLHVEKPKKDTRPLAPTHPARPIMHIWLCQRPASEHLTYATGVITQCGIYIIYLSCLLTAKRTALPGFKEPPRRSVACKGCAQGLVTDFVDVAGKQGDMLASV